jgi:hypothetical protein
MRRERGGGGVRRMDEGLLLKTITQVWQSCMDSSNDEKTVRLDVTEVQCKISHGEVRKRKTARTCKKNLSSEGSKEFCPSILLEQGSAHVLVQ